MKCLQSCSIILIPFPASGSSYSFYSNSARCIFSHYYSNILSICAPCPGGLVSTRAVRRLAGPPAIHLTSYARLKWKDQEGHRDLLTCVMLPDALTWLSFSMTIPLRSCLWVETPPTSMAYFSGRRKPGVVLRVPDSWPAQPADLATASSCCERLAMPDVLARQLRADLSPSKMHLAGPVTTAVWVTVSGPEGASKRAYAGTYAYRHGPFCCQKGPFVFIKWNFQAASTIFSSFSGISQILLNCEVRHKKYNHHSWIFWSHKSPWNDG